jgi:hypothetical protein
MAAVNSPAPDVGATTSVDGLTGRDRGFPWGHPISTVVADDISFVVHLGNAGRPRRRQPAHRRHHGSTSRSGNGLDGRAHTGDAPDPRAGGVPQNAGRGRWSEAFESGCDLPVARDRDEMHTLERS